MHRKARVGLCFGSWDNGNVANAYKMSAICTTPAVGECECRGGGLIWRHHGKLGLCCHTHVGIEKSSDSGHLNGPLQSQTGTIWMEMPPGGDRNVLSSQREKCFLFHLISYSLPSISAALSYPLLTLTLSPTSSLNAYFKGEGQVTKQVHH